MLNDSNILITGGTGSLGNTLARKILTAYKPNKLIIFSRCEYKQAMMAQEFAEFENIRFLLGDIRDKCRLNDVFEGVEYVIHTAALKRIPTLEYNPTEAIKTNIAGSMNVIKEAMDSGVKKAVLISTDKACEPLTLYGTTKLAAEKLFLAANSFNKTDFLCVRYGNVLASRGSVIELFLKLKEKGEKFFPITDRRMTRFWITLGQAAELVLIALEQGKRNSILVPKLPTMSITEVARTIEPECVFKNIGIRASEKLHETLIATGEENIYLVCLDSKSIMRYDSEKSYSSNKNQYWLSKKEFRELMKDKFNG
jgi:UDP-N-acetylglucosamine 4,6-dehydratase